jgi:uncharacterized protein (DUF2126 family)
LVEGYTPPHDPALNVRFKVTPDPGVIEVNTHPGRVVGRTGEEHDRALRRGAAYRLAPKSSCWTGGTPAPGGGNHIVVGGPTPADSPLLRNPDLLRSLIGYWHNHPSLSYLFSGMFVGPTSQAPRVDEARNDQVYELEIAFGRFPKGAIARRGWWTASSGIFWSTRPATRTGPSSASTSCTRRKAAAGRLGLLEMRAFEMPPHSRMSLTQHLLLRSLIARFWKQPYRQRIWCAGARRYTTGSCCRISCRQDLDDVIDELNEAGYPLERMVRAAL